jgi:hypothetical protein
VDTNRIPDIQGVKYYQQKQNFVEDELSYRHQQLLLFGIDPA